MSTMILLGFSDRRIIEVLDSRTREFFFLKSSALFVSSLFPLEEAKIDV